MSSTSSTYEPLRLSPDIIHHTQNKEHWPFHLPLKKRRIEEGSNNGLSPAFPPDSIGFTYDKRSSSPVTSETSPSRESEKWRPSSQNGFSPISTPDTALFNSFSQ